MSNKKIKMKRTKFPQPKIENYLDLLRKIAWSFHITTGVEYDELFGEACLCYCETIKKYDRSKGAVSTFVYQSTINWIKVFLRNYQQFSYIEELAYDPVPMVYYDFLDDYSDNVNQVLTLADLYNMQDRKNPSTNQRLLKEELSEKGWDQKRISSALQETKHELELKKF